MTLENLLSFAKVIEDHLELKRRNSGLEQGMPIDGYRSQDPFQNHPLFKSEEQARLEETQSGTEPISMEEELVLAFPAAGEETDPTLAQTDTDGHLWSRSREFDWGD
jgi:hypothetical protein